MRFDHQRAAAAEIACPEPGCNAPAGEPCRNLANGEELGHRPAHERRLWAVGVLAGPSGAPAGPAYQETR